MPRKSPYRRCMREGCDKAIPRATWLCVTHWHRTPLDIRTKLMHVTSDEQARELINSEVQTSET